jgi:DNA-binding transcriptional ArsR family regulator
MDETVDHCELLCLDLEQGERLRTSRLNAEAAVAKANAAKALSDPTRLTLAAVLGDSDGELCVCDLAWILERSQKLTSHHVRQLRMAGLVTSRRDGKMVMYDLTEEGERLLGSVLGVGSPTI